MGAAHLHFSGEAANSFSAAHLSGVHERRRHRSMNSRPCGFDDSPKPIHARHEQVEHQAATPRGVKGDQKLNRGAEDRGRESNGRNQLANRIATSSSSSSSTMNTVGSLTVQA
jgi:hypothetical protein